MYQVFIIEDHPTMREALRALIEHEEDMHICGFAPTGADAYKQLAALATPPDLVLIDLSLPDVSGVQLLKQLHTQDPGMKLIVVSGHEASQYRATVLHEGALEYLDKRDAYTLLVATMRRMLEDKPIPQ